DLRLGRSRLTGREFRLGVAGGACRKLPKGSAFAEGGHFGVATTPEHEGLEVPHVVGVAGLLQGPTQRLGLKDRPIVGVTASRDLLPGGRGLVARDLDGADAEVLVPPELLRNA